MLEKALSNSERRRRTIRDGVIIQNKSEMRNWNKFVFQLLFTLIYAVTTVVLEGVRCCKA